MKSIAALSEVRLSDDVLRSIAALSEVRLSDVVLKSIGIIKRNDLEAKNLPHASTDSPQKTVNNKQAPLGSAEKNKLK